ncbi:MAG: transposase [Candidatus Rokubacteria bacterium]|nr:transposase [Candidatus Rokubacteria bacterium]
MAYREVTMLEVKEVLRLWLGGAANKRIAAQLGLNVKTVRRYVAAARASGVVRASGLEALDDGLIAAVVSRVQPHLGRPRGDGWGDCTAQRAVIERFLRQGVRLSKVRKLLRRQGVEVSYATLRRFAIAELGFGGTAPTIPLADCGPGEEVQLDTGWMTHLAADPAIGRRRRFRAWIFTAVLSRYRFVYPVLRETTETAIEACEAAWAFFHGVFRVLIPDNTKAIVQRADPLEPRLTPAFLEYAQARGFVIDPTRVRHAKDKARVERAVASVRDDCFAGEALADLEHARAHARHWCHEEYGARRHSRTLRAPREHFEAVEQPALRHPRELLGRQESRSSSLPLVRGMARLPESLLRRTGDLRSARMVPPGSEAESHRRGELDQVFAKSRSHHGPCSEASSQSRTAMAAILLPGSNLHRASLRLASSWQIPRPAGPTAPQSRSSRRGASAGIRSWA